MRLLIGLLIAGAGVAAAAQNYEARHDHVRGHCTGKLTFDEQGVSFESATKQKHSWKVSYLDARQIQALDSGEFRLLTYKDRKWRLGADREYKLRVADPQFAAQVSPMLEKRLEHRFVAGLVEKAASPLWEIPAKHLLRFEGTEGLLSAGEDRVVYKSDRPGDSRTWFFSDIDHISRSDLYELTITTYERARSHYGDRKDFNFRLKQPLSEQQYDDLWRRIEKSKGLQVSAPEPATDPFLALHQSLEKAVGRPLWAAAGLQPSPASQGPASALAPPAAPDPHRIIQVESRFNRWALSPKGARGLWQLTPETARRFGLRVDAQDDERVDPARSTRAATRYLAYLRSLFGDWRLALAAYNAGENRVLRAIDQGGTRDFYELSRRGLLPEETRRYVPAVFPEEKERRQ